MTPDDRHLLGELRTMWTDLDPCPPDLAERALFRLALEHLDVEIMALEPALSGAGARSAELASTVTFKSPALSVTITVSAAEGGRHARRVDGWITPPADLTVLLHTVDGVQESRADTDGRFAFAHVPSGLVHLRVEPTPGAAPVLARAVATPAIAI
jgi:hypothetical protein